MSDKSGKEPRRDANWPKDRFGADETMAWLFYLSPVLIALIALAALWAMNSTRKGPAVVVYCAQDQVYAEQIFRQFRQEAGIRVLPLYDSEAVKTVGLVNRLIAESNEPRADLFWGNEEFRARQLAKRGILQTTNGLAFFGYRSRRLVINTNTFDLEKAPKSWLELTNAAWYGKLAFGYPQFGTTSTHFHALRQHWGDQVWRDWCRGLVANKSLVVDGNSVVVKLVAAGEAAIGMTDSDDIAAAQREGAPVAALPLDPESMLIANAIGKVARGPKPGPADELFKYLQKPEVIRVLIEALALEGSDPAKVTPAVIRPDWEAMLRDLDITVDFLNQTFLR